MIKQEGLNGVVMKGLNRGGVGVWQRIIKTKCHLKKPF